MRPLRSNQAHYRLRCAKCRWRNQKQTNVLTASTIILTRIYKLHLGVKASPKSLKTTAKPTSRFWKESDYAVNLTHSPYKMMGADIMGLRDANLMIKGFFEVNHMAVHYNYANRIDSRLGVELETD